MPFVLSLLGGAGIAYALIESGYAIEALLLLCLWIALLWIWPPAAMWFITIAVVLSIIAVCVMFWEFIAAAVIALLLFVLLVGGLLNVIHYYHERLL